MKYHKIELKEYISGNVSTRNTEGLKKWMEKEALRLVKFHPSNRPQDLGNNPKLAGVFTSKGFSLVLCADSLEAIPVLEEALNETGIKLVKVDCRSFSDRNSMINHIAQETQFSHNGPFEWSPVGARCNTSVPWDYILLLDHVEAFDPIDEKGNENVDLRFCLRTVGSILKNDSHSNPPTIAIVSPTTYFSDEFLSELYTRSYAMRFIYSK